MGSASLRVWALAALVVAFWFAAKCAYDRPPPVPASAPATEFSAMRADATLARILGPARPHPAGTPENVAERGRILNELAKMGVPATTYRAFACNPVARFPVVTCATVTDILAEETRGPAEGKAVLMLAHYDSVPAGPGAADDASGDATILETIRALRARGGVSKHPVLALFTDGEEYGLLGAAAFLDQPTYRDMVGAVINVEARGSTGPSFLFQTSPGDARLIDLYARSVPRYATSSVYAEIYRFLPNDTDLTLFIRDGLTGYNFAFLGTVADYHTPLDTLKNLSLVTLQQHGDNMLGLASALEQTDFASLKGGNDIYADFFGLVLPRMSARFALPLSIVAFLMIAAAAFLSRDAAMGWKSRIAAFAMPLALLIGTTLAGLGLSYLAQIISGMPDPSYAHPLALRIAFALGVWSVVLLAAPLASRISANVVWLWFAALSIIVSIFLTGFAPYFLFPALVAAVLLLATARNTKLRPWALLISALPALALWIGFVAQGEMLMGLQIPPLFTVPAAFGLLVLMPLMPEMTSQSRRVAIGITFGGAIIAAAIAGLQPAYSETWPLRLNLNYVEDHVNNRALWTADANAPLPEGLRAAAKFGREPEKPYPSAFFESYVAPAGAMRFAPPSAQVTAQNGRVTLQLQGSPDTAQIYVIVPKAAGLTAFTINGKHFAAPHEWAARDQVMIGCMTPDCAHATMVLDLASKKPVTLTLVERRVGLPAFGKFLAAARPKTAVPSQLGDGTFVISAVKVP